MSMWKLIVDDYGKIRHAKIEIAPLTLFVGDNNSGKSYLLSLLWGEEWNGNNFGLNQGDRMIFSHSPVQMVRNEEGVLIGTCAAL